MYVYMSMYMYMCMHTYMYMYLYLYIYIYVGIPTRHTAGSTMLLSEHWGQHQAVLPQHVAAPLSF